MNAVDMARNAYARPEAPVRSLRSIEYDLFARVTQRLTSAWARHTTDFPALASALDDNNRLWTTLAADVSETDNGLPGPLRAQLFYLYEFAADHSRRVLAGGASVDALVDINTAVMRGLRGNAGGRP